MPRKKKKKRPLKRPANEPIKGLSMGQGADVETAVRELLERYSCPYPFHQVRAGFMGNIASPDLHVTPLRELERAWNGELPVFASEHDIHPFMQTMLMDFYKKLCAHQNQEQPFNLVNLYPTSINREFLSRFGRVRREELEGFIGGLFCGQDEIGMPEQAHSIIQSLREKLETFASEEKSTIGPLESEDRSSIERTLAHLQELTLASEKEINIIIQLGNAARAQLMEMLRNDRSDNLH